MKTLINKLGGRVGLFWIGILIPGRILVTLFIVGNNGAGEHGHQH